MTYDDHFERENDDRVGGIWPRTSACWYGCLTDSRNGLQHTQIKILKYVAGLEFQVDAHFDGQRKEMEQILTSTRGVVLFRGC